MDEKDHNSCPPAGGRPVRVGLDASRLGTGRGPERFTSVLVDALLTEPCGIRLSLYVRDDFAAAGAPASPGVELRRGDWGLRLLHRPGTGWLFRPRLRGLDVFHFPTGDIWYGRRAPAIVNLHDAAPLRRPDRFFTAPAAERRYRRHVDRVARHADAVVTGSHFARRELEEVAGIPSARVRVIPDAVAPAFAVTPSPAAAAAARRCAGVEGPFVLCVGGNDYRKNLGGAAAAVALLPATTAGPLVIAGRRGEGRLYDAPDTLPACGALERAGRLRWAGRVDDATLAALYRAARALIFPSLYEGFGLPPLEAMACGTPVVAARAASLPEVLGDAAVYADPQDAEGLSAALASVLADGDLRRTMIARGHACAQCYSATQLARRYAALYREFGP